MVLLYAMGKAKLHRWTLVHICSYGFSHPLLIWSHAVFYPVFLERLSTIGVAMVILDMQPSTATNQDAYFWQYLWWPLSEPPCFKNSIEPFKQVWLGDSMVPREAFAIRAAEPRCLMCSPPSKSTRDLGTSIDPHSFDWISYLACGLHIIMVDVYWIIISISTNSKHISHINQLWKISILTIFIIWKSNVCFLLLPYIVNHMNQPICQMFGNHINIYQ